jgi:N-acetylglutamate synthase-like GNAT family acetyltransferase
MDEVTFRDTIRTCDIKNIVASHRLLYEKEFGFNSEFGDYVEESLKENVAKIWIAEVNKEFSGCIGVARAGEKIAQLRWFLVEPKMRGKNIGRRLLHGLIEYCKANEDELVFLWTVDGLSAARKLYEEFGFTLTESKPKRLLWGKSIIEQRWDLSLRENL